MMNSARIAACVLFVMVSQGAAFAQRNFDDVRIKTSHVAGKVYMLEGSGGNIGVSVGDDGILMIDDQFAPLADKIRAALKELSTGKLAFVLNTHWHGDHTGGNVEFGPEAPVIAHTNVRKRLSTKQHIRGRTIEPLDEDALPVITFDESLSIHFNGEEIRAIHMPHGHTDGDIVIHFTESNVVHMGDHFFADRFPFVDLESGGSVQGYAANVGKVLARLEPGVKIIPGHGRLADAADLQRFHAMLTGTIAIVREQINAGKDLEAVKARGLPEKYEAWGTGFIKTNVWVETVYKSLASKDND